MAMLSPSLMELCLSHISSLVELPSSFQNLHQLYYLEISNCVNLETLPTEMNLKSLNRLDLWGCSRLRMFPDLSTNIKYLDLSETAIGEIPLWIEKFSMLRELVMQGCNELEYVNLNISKLKHLRRVDFSDCKASTRASWNDSLSVENDLPTRVAVHFTNCFNLDQESLFQQKTYLNWQLRLPGEEVPSYFTHRTTGTSSSLTIPLLHSSLSQPFLRFRACVAFDCHNVFGLDMGGFTAYPLRVIFLFKGRFWNSFDSFVQPQDFWACTDRMYDINSWEKESRLFIMDCRIPLSNDSAALAEMNYNHVDLQINIKFTSEGIREWGIRPSEDSSSAENRLGNPNTLPHVFEADEEDILND